MTKDQQNDEAWFGLAKAYLQQDEPGKVRELLQTVPDAEISENNKRCLVEAYNYLAAYETNTEKDYEEAIGYFEKVLDLNPSDADAKNTRRY